MTDKPNENTTLFPWWPSARARQITLVSMVALWASSCALAVSAGRWKSDFIAELGLGISSLVFVLLILVVVFEALWNIWRWIRRMFS